MLKNLINIKSTFITCFLLAHLALSSNHAVAQKFSLGVRAGGLASWTAFGNKDDKQLFDRATTTGYQAGGLLKFPLKNNYDVLLEAGISKKKKVLSFPFSGGFEVYNHTHLRMADASMLMRKSFKFMLKKDTPAEAFVNLGPEINYWYNAKGYFQLGKDGTKYDYEVVFGESEEAAVVYEDVNQWLFSLSFGAGLKVPLRNPRQSITTELRFTSGHTHLGKRNSASYREYLGMPDTLEVNLKVINLSVAYVFDFDKKEAKKGKSTLKKKMKKGG